MTTAYTSLLGLALPVTGELSGTWGDTVNNSITSLLDTSVAGTTNVSTDADVTLTTTTGAANTARQAILLLSGARTALRTVTAPAQSKIYTVINATTGGFSVKLVGAGPTTGVTIIAGESAVCAWNGSDFIKISNTGGSASFVNLTASGTVTFTGLTASQAVFTNASDELVSNAITGTGNVVMSASPTLTGTISAAAATLSGNLTLSGGTANGVAYLNGSKVVTSGSALTFDGTDFSATGTTTVNSANSTQVALVLKGETGNGIRQRFIGQAASGQYNWQIGASITAAGSFAIIPSTAVDGTTFSTAAYAITGTGTSIWSVGGSEGMRLTSTGLGIGTSSPAVKLESYGASNGATLELLRLNNAGSGANTASQIVFRTAGSNYADIIGGYGAVSARLSFNVAAGGYQSFAIGGSDKLTLDGSGNLGLGVTPSAWSSIFKVMQVGAGASYIGGRTDSVAGRQIWLGTNSYYDGTNWLYSVSQPAAQYYQNDGAHIWNTAPSGTAGNAITFTQAMTLDASGNLGIGTSSPAYKLDVSVGTNTIAQQWQGAGTSFTLRLKSGLGTTASSSVYRMYMDYLNGSSINGYIDFYRGAAGNDGYLVFGTSGSDKLTLDSSGNLGLGVTPSASWTGYKAIQVGTGASFGGYASDVLAFVGSNCYNDNTNWRYLVSGNVATRYQQSGGTHLWYNAPSGTAGNAITFTQAMTLDASGNLGVGTTSPSYRLDVKGAVGADATIRIVSNNSNDYSSKLFFGDNVSTRGSIIYDNYVNSLTFWTNSTERARIDSSGNFGIGTTSPATKLNLAMSAGAGTPQIRMDQASDNPYIEFDRWSGSASDFNGARIYAAGGSPNLVFAVAPTATTIGSLSFSEAMRIDSSGNLLVGTTSTNRGNAGFQVASNGQFYSSTDSSTNLNLRRIVSNGDAATFTAISGSIVGAITIGTTTTTYNTSSDYRLKNTIAPMTGALAKVALLKPCTYKWNADGSDGQGFIAHELAEVVPQCVTGEKDALDADGKPQYQGIDTSFLVATLTAALQEAVAKINSLEARLDAANL